MTTSRSPTQWTTSVIYCKALLEDVLQISGWETDILCGTGERYWLRITASKKIGNSTLILKFDSEKPDEKEYQVVTAFEVRWEARERAPREALDGTTALEIFGKHISHPQNFHFREGEKTLVITVPADLLRFLDEYDWLAKAMGRQTLRS